MAEPLKIGTVSVKPGQVQRGGIPIGRDLYGNERELPIVVYRGAQEGPRLWINGATHGDEPEGPYSIMRTLPQLDPGEMAGTLVAVPVMNIEAFMQGDRGDPRDTFSYDMNRVYPGRADGYATERVAWAHWQAMAGNCDLQIAIHSGGDHSFLDKTIFAAETGPCLELAGAMGPAWDLVNTSGVGRGSPAAMLAEQGQAAITVELGGWCRMLTTEFHEIGRQLSDAYLNVMRHYSMIPGEAQYAASWQRGHQIALLANETGLWVGEDVELRKPLKKGTPLGRIYNLYGDELEVVRAPEDGVIFGLRFRPMVLRGDWLCFYAVIDEIRDDLIPGQ
jgi:predicted deacylase